jgi:hypothetical protein
MTDGCTLLNLCILKICHCQYNKTIYFIICSFPAHQCRVMSEMTVKLQFFFDYCEIRKSKHSRSYVNLFMMSRNQKEQNLGR